MGGGQQFGDSRVFLVVPDEPRKDGLIVQIPGSLRFGSCLFRGKIDKLGRGEKNGGKIDAILSGEGNA